jgi:hypothetical protein
MPQPNKGTHGKPNVAEPVKGDAGSKSSDWDKVHTGIHTKGTKGSGSGTK